MQSGLDAKGITISMLIIEFSLLLSTHFTMSVTRLADMSDI